MVDLKTLCSESIIMVDLKTLCSTVDPIKRRELILSALNGSPRIQKYGEYYNIYSYMEAGKDKTIAVTAHYDIANPESENCLDNNASVLNLINLHNLLIEARDKLKYNILVAFIDAEETVDPFKCGINHLVNHFDVDQLIDLELTASGDKIIMAKYGNFDLFDYPMHSFPFNNAAVADLWWRHLKKHGGSACLVTVTDEDLAELDETGFCKRFGMCHTKNDTIEKWANSTHMDKLVKSILAHLIESNPIREVSIVD